MPLPEVLSHLGRRVRLGVVGGGPGALIGPVHRAAARLDDCFEIVAGLVSSRPERAAAAAAELAIPRGYSDFARMIAAEGARADGIDAVAIMTPNDSHFELARQALEAGLDVLCDKPLTNDTGSARALCDLAARAGRVLVLAHNYSGYPMIREARAAVAAGELGPLRLVNLRYLQGSLATLVEAEPTELAARLRWRLDPARGGASHVMMDIGVHAFQMLTFVTGQRVASVLADVGPSLPGRDAHDTGQVILRLDDGTRGSMLVTKLATGAQNDLSIEVHGEDGGLDWQQSAPGQLRVMRQGRPDEIRVRGLPTLHPSARRAARSPVGHPEAFFEAFANVYTDFAEQVAARIAGAEPDPLALLAPTGKDGADALAFVDACLASTARGGWVEVAY